MEIKAKNRKWQTDELIHHQFISVSLDDARQRLNLFVQRSVAQLLHAKWHQNK